MDSQDYQNNSADLEINEPLLGYESELTPIEHCLCCGEKLIGRIDKKFCNAYCKSQYHYTKEKAEEPRFYIQVSKQLRQNRKLLSKYNKSGKAVVVQETLHAQGFNPHFYTHRWRSSSGAMYYFVYEFGFMLDAEHGKVKYVLIKWQPYMNKSVTL